jgi:hypothetical protein
MHVIDHASHGIYFPSRTAPVHFKYRECPGTGERRAGQSTVPWLNLWLPNQEMAWEMTHALADRLYPNFVVPTWIKWRPDPASRIWGHATYGDRHLLIRRPTMAVLLHELAHLQPGSWEARPGKTYHAHHGPGFAANLRILCQHAAMLLFLPA